MIRRMILIRSCHPIFRPGYAHMNYKYKKNIQWCIKFQSEFREKKETLFRTESKGLEN
jgi:hypothetical protein